MAVKHLTTVPWTALVAVLVALAIGSVPVATLVALSAQMEALK